MHTLKKSMCNITSFDKGLQSIVINFSSLKNTQNYIFNFIVDYVILVSVRLLHCIKLVVCDINKLKRQIKISVNRVLIHNKVKFGQFRHYVHGFDLAWIVPLRTVKKFCRKLSIITVGK